MDDKLHTMGGNMVRLGITILLLVGSCCFADSPPQDSGEINAGDRCVLALTFNEGPGAKDWSDLAQVTTNNTGTWAAKERADGGAYIFNGTTDRILLSNSSFFDAGYGSFSISAWIKSTTAAINDGIVCKFDNVGGKNVGYALRAYSANNVNFIMGDSGGNYANITGSEVVIDGTWHHVVGVLNRVTIIQFVYVDGVLDNSGSAANLVGDNLTTSFYCSIADRYHEPGGEWPGSIDEVMIFQRALSADEVKVLYEKGRVQ